MCGMLKCPWKQKGMSKVAIVETFFSRSLIGVLGTDAYINLMHGQNMGRADRQSSRQPAWAKPRLPSKKGEDQNSSCHI